MTCKYSVAEESLEHMHPSFQYYDVSISNAFNDITKQI